MATKTGIIAVTRPQQAGQSVNNRAADLMKLITILGALSALVSGLVTWTINYGIANGQTEKELEFAEKDRVRIESQAAEKIEKVDKKSEEARKKAEDNEKKIVEMYGAINETRNAVKRIEERLK